MLNWFLYILMWFLKYASLETNILIMQGFLAFDKLAFALVCLL